MSRQVLVRAARFLSRDAVPRAAATAPNQKRAFASSGIVFADSKDSGSYSTTENISIDYPEHTSGDDIGHHTTGAERRVGAHNIFGMELVG